VTLIYHFCFYFQQRLASWAVEKIWPRWNIVLSSKESIKHYITSGLAYVHVWAAGICIDGFDGMKYESGEGGLRKLENNDYKCPIIIARQVWGKSWHLNAAAPATSFFCSLVQFSWNTGNAEL
jgi:hypothetical protein